MNKKQLKEKVTKLRRQGRTYKEIQNIVKKTIPKSTISYWCGNINLPKSYYKKVQENRKIKLIEARKVALSVNKAKRKKYLKSIVDRNKHLFLKLKDKNVAKIVLAVLYLGEGSKNPKRGSLVFGNSDPFIIDMFLYLLRYCYKIDESKFRCTLQCRHDQNIKKLEKFWSRITKIDPSKFYKARIDSRTIGKKSIKPDYKGVCRIDYFSAEILIELLQIPKIIFRGPIA